MELRTIPLTPNKGYSFQGTPKQKKINQSSYSNINNISKLSNQSSASIYLERKHQATKEKIEKMRYEAYNKMMAEVKPKPTISKNSKEIINKLFKDNGRNSDYKLPISRSFSHHDSIKGGKKKKLNYSLTYSNINKNDQYRMIIESRERRLREIMQEEKMKQKRSKSVQLKGKKKILQTEEIKCQRDRAFKQEYTPYNEQIVFDIRDKLQRYYDDKIEYKAIPFNHVPETKNSKIMNCFRVTDRENPVLLVQTGEFGGNSHNNREVQRRKSNDEHNNAKVGRRERDIKLLSAFAEGLGQNINVKMQNKATSPQLRPNISDEKAYNEKMNRNQLDSYSHYKQLNPNAYVYGSGRMINNMQIQDPSVY